MKEALEKELAKFDESLRPELRAAYETPHDQRTDAQKELLAARPSLNISPGVLYQYLPKAAEDLKSYDKRIGEIRAKKPSEEFLRALVEPANHVPETKLFHRGDHEQPKQTVEPAALTVAAPAGARHKFPIDDPALPSTGRRLAFARWLTSRHNPLTARVIVNRVWMHHFGEGLVASPADFGKLGALPTHPELLDWLADQFVVSGWSFKQLHRLIMSSTVWRQRADPHSIYPMRLRRLDAETLRDRMLASSGALDRTLYGRPVRAVEDGRGQVAIEDSAPRRSIYAQVRRSLPIGFLHTFDAPVMKTLCRRRESSTASTQSLTLLNGPFVLQQAAALAERVKRETSGEDGDPDRQNEKISGVEALAVRKAWQFAYCREPQPEELPLANGDNE